MLRDLISPYDPNVLFVVAAVFGYQRVTNSSRAEAFSRLSVQPVTTPLAQGPDSGY